MDVCPSHSCLLHQVDGATPLYIACQNGAAAVVEALCGAGADTNIARVGAAVNKLGDCVRCAFPTIFPNYRTSFVGGLLLLAERWCIAPADRVPEGLQRSRPHPSGPRRRGPHQSSMGACTCPSCVVLLVMVVNRVSHALLFAGLVAGSSILAWILYLTPSAHVNVCVHACGTDKRCHAAVHGCRGG